MERRTTDFRAKRRAFPSGAYDRVLPALPPFYAQRFGRSLANLSNALSRPPDALFYQNEQEFYLHFAWALGFGQDRQPAPSLPIASSGAFGVTRRALVLAPGCKTGEMAAKRWPHFPELAAEFAEVVVSTGDDLQRSDGSPFTFPPHVRSFAGKLTLRQAAELLAAAGAVVGNDSGLSHIAVAVGTPTVMLFGPTPHESLGPLPSNAHVLRLGLTCEPCWFRERFGACAKRIECLTGLDTQSVAAEVRALL